MKRVLMVAGGFLMLAGCQSGLDIKTAPVNVAYTGNPKIGHIAGHSNSEIRSYRTVDGKRTEVAGAKCRAEGHGFVADFVTPAVVRFPDMNARTRDLVISCTLDGQRRSKPVAAINMTSKRNHASNSRNGLIGALVGGVVESSRDKSRDNFGYGNIGIEF